MKPWQFRPGDDAVDWEDNFLSNALAWVSHKVLPRWCQSPEHWTAKVSAYLFTDCPCCLLFRGMTIGATMASLFFVAVLLLLRLA